MHCCIVVVQIKHAGIHFAAECASDEGSGDVLGIQVVYYFTNIFMGEQTKCAEPLPCYSSTYPGDIVVQIGW